MLEGPRFEPVSIDGKGLRFRRYQLVAMKIQEQNSLVQINESDALRFGGPSEQQEHLIRRLPAQIDHTLVRKSITESPGGPGREFPISIWVCGATGRPPRCSQEVGLAPQTLDQGNLTAPDQKSHDGAVSLPSPEGEGGKDENRDQKAANAHRPLSAGIIAPKAHV
jgi:hypothetical protein